MGSETRDSGATQHDKIGKITIPKESAKWEDLNLLKARFD
jgi:hypothetical protein